MKTVSVGEARANLHRLIDETAVNHEPVVIAGNRYNAVLISQADWSAIQDALFLHTVPGIGASILEGIGTPLEQCAKELKC